MLLGKWECAQQLYIPLHASEKPISSPNKTSGEVAELRNPVHLQGGEYFTANVESGNEDEC